ncbi:MAG: DoxX family protein [Caldilineaceae bacterium]|jgi:uncharacterized membrane protein YphA (DoxX/SURF4 family)
MNLLLWVLQILLAALFIFHGGALLNPPAAMQAVFASMFAPLPAGFQQFIGIAELAGGLGLLLPWITKIARWLTGWAALGLAIIMLGAVVMHAQRGEFAQVIPTGVITLLLGFVAWGRWQGLGSRQ